MLRQLPARCGGEPFAQLRRIHPQHRGLRDRRPQALMDWRVVRYQPDPVDAALFLAQPFTQLALQIQVLPAAAVAGAASHTDQQPLAAQGGQRNAGAVE